MATLATPLRNVIGGRAAASLEKAFDLHTVGELLRHYPRRYAERGELTDLAEVKVGDQVTVLAEVRRVNRRPMRNRRGSLLEVLVGDGRRTLTLTFFNQPWRERELAVGRIGLFAGKVTAFRGNRQLNSPDYFLLGDAVADGTAGGVGSDAESTIEEFAGALIPVYPASAGLPSWTIARCVRVALEVLDPPADPLPEPLRRRHSLVDLGTALHDVHRPPGRPARDAARTRLTWDEALTLQVALAQRRRAAAARPAVPRPPKHDSARAAFDASLPFTLTAGQREVGAVISDELARAHPMHRLLQGEVGSGKTVCAVRAMLQVVDAGGQAALLAPTEVLAAQHARSLDALLGPLGHAGELDAAEHATRVALLTGSLSAATRRQALADAASGAAGIIIGTHALLQEGVEFADLGLVVIDEQHRFGVEQRDALRAKASSPPHVLVMTATPIPRTVAMTVYGDLETSALRELPGGRSPISTTVVPAAERPAWLARAWQRVREEVEAGHQAYVVCPRIGEDGIGDDGTADEGVGRVEYGGVEDGGVGDGSVGGEGVGDDGMRGDSAGDGGIDASGRHARSGRGRSSGLRSDDEVSDRDGPEATDDEDGGGPRRPPLAVSEVAPMLAEGPLNGLRLGVLHGRLGADEKDAVMRGFADGAIDVLVATTVVEVGVDVPNATVMVLLDADRFGVSQLHQLRGRVGRGSAPGLCLLVTDAPAETDARHRLDAVASTVDGFELARLDLEQRREGQVLGEAQSGRSSFKLLSLLRDEALISQAREEAGLIVQADPDLREHPELATAVAEFVGEERAEYLEKG